MDRPIDAVALGAAAYAAGAILDDHIQHDYAVRFWNPLTSRQEYRTIVRNGTRYPAKDVARMGIKASYDGQSQLGIPIYEIRQGEPGTPEIELVADPSGCLRILEEKTGEESIFFWINESQPTFLTADPPAVKGKIRFEITFNIDGNKRLLITARDTLSGAMVMENYPAVRLR